MPFLVGFSDIFTVLFCRFVSTLRSIKMYTLLKCLSTSLRQILLQNISEFWPFWLQSSVCRNRGSVKCLRFSLTTFWMKRTSLLFKDAQNYYRIFIYLKKSQKDKLSCFGIPVSLVEKLPARNNKRGKQFMNSFSRSVKAVKRWLILSSRKPFKPLTLSPKLLK